MLHILLMLLKIISILILVILGLIILVLGIVLFVPVRYSGTASIKDGIESVKANLRFSWFMYFVSGWINYEDKKMKWHVRILHKKFDSEEQVEEAKESVSEKQVKEVKESIAEESEEAEPVEKLSLEESNKEESKKEETASINSETKKASKKQAKKKETKKQSILDKIKYTIRNICDKIKMLKQKKDEIVALIKNEIYQSAFKKLLKELGRLLKVWRPKKLHIKAHFGFEDPSLTGKALAFFGMLYPFYGDNIRIQPDFEEAVLEGDMYVKGHLRVVHAARMLWNLVWDKHVRTTFKDIMKIEK